VVDEGVNILGRLSKLGYHTKSVFQTETPKQSYTQQTYKKHSRQHTRKQQAIITPDKAL
jgi:hypothetical protein